MKGRYRHLTFIGLIVLLFSRQTAIGQNQRIADSLLSLDISQLSKNQQWNIYQEISYNSTIPLKKIEYSEKALGLAQTDQEKASSFINLAQAYRLQGNLTKSLDFALKALQILKQSDNKQNIATTANTISATYLEVPDYEQATKYIWQSIKINQELKNSVNLASDYNNLGEIYRLDNKPDSALFYFREARQLYEKSDVPIGIAYTTGNIGLVYAEKGDFKAAEQRIEEAKDILLKTKDYYPVIVYNQSLAEIFQSKNQLPRATALSLSTLAIAKEHGLNAQVRDLSELLSTLYEEQEDYKNAHLYQQQFMLYKDSLMNETAIRQMAKLQADYDLGLKQAEIDLLNKENLMQQFFALGLILILALSLLLAYIWYRSSRDKQRANQLLVQQTQQLQTQRDELELLNNTRNKFFSIISHDLRGPVNAFDGISKLMDYYAQNGNYTELKEASKHLNKSANQLSRLLDNLLGWSLSQQGEFPFKPEVMYLRPLCEDILQVFESMAHSKGIKLYTTMPEELQVYGDYNSISTILRNLVSNALKFTEEGGKVGILAKIEEKQVVVQVADSGIGIPPERLKKLFQLRDDKRTWGTAGEKGLGIGLRLAFEFAEKNNGKLLVESEEGNGTTFSLLLPLHQPAEVVA